MIMQPIIVVYSIFDGYGPVLLFKMYPEDENLTVVTKTIDSFPRK